MSYEVTMPPRIFPGDEELGKRDDDHIPRKITANPLLSILMQSRLPQKRNLKRLGIFFVILVGLYYFFQYMQADVEQVSRRPNYRYTPEDGASTWPHAKPATRGGKTATSPKKKGIPALDEETNEKHSFNGPIKFYKLATSLHEIIANGGGNWLNQNVLFAASSLKSASALLPMACEMSILKRNKVHFALLGRDEIPIASLKQVNGVEEGCDIMYHDARPDFSVQSSDYRMEVSDGAALNHINNFMHPQAIIIDGSSLEDEFFKRAFRIKSASLDRALIELPKNAEQNLMWLTRLDSSSLSAWNRVSTDILIHAQTAASGSLMRLLTSLSKADYFSSTPPALTIELPEKIDGPTKDFLKTFKWPPAPHSRVEGNSNRLTLRHRVSRYGLTPEESSVRFLESFWPANPESSHVLILAPQVELSPLFYHYLQFTVLEYKYGSLSGMDRTLMGISLDLPSTYLNDSMNFLPPFLKDSPEPETVSKSPFLWQAPNSNAVLYFGQHWMELHSFIGQSVTSKHELPTPTTLNKKFVSKTYPSWLEHILSLCRTRGYAFIYPNLANRTALATVHNELYHPPEEFTSEEEDMSTGYTNSEEDWVVDTAHLSLSHEEMPLAKTSLFSVLPSDAVPESIGSMPRLTWDGNEVSALYDLQVLATAYSEIFKQEIGGCTVDDEGKLRVDGNADDLFCLGKKSKPVREERDLPEPGTGSGVLASPPKAPKAVSVSDSSRKQVQLPKDVEDSKIANTDAVEVGTTAIDGIAIPGLELPVAVSNGDISKEASSTVEAEKIVNIASPGISDIETPKKDAPALQDIPASVVKGPVVDFVETGNKPVPKVEDIPVEAEIQQKKVYKEM